MPTTTVVSTSEAREGLADLCERAAHGERVLISHNKPCVAMVPAEDLDLLESLEDEADLELARRALARARREGTVPLEDVARDLSGSRLLPRAPRARPAGCAR